MDNNYVYSSYCRLNAYESRLDKQGLMNLNFNPKREERDKYEQTDYESCPKKTRLKCRKK